MGEAEICNVYGVMYYHDWMLASLCGTFFRQQVPLHRQSPLDPSLFLICYQIRTFTPKMSSQFLQLIV